MAKVAGVIALQVGPDSVRMLSVARPPVGRPVDPELARAALEWIDDPVGLYDGRPVSVADLWRLVMTTALGGDGGARSGSVMLVHPDDWPSHRVDRVVAAANAVADEVVPIRRSDWSPAPADLTEPGPQPAIEPVRDSAAQPPMMNPARRRPALLIGATVIGATGIVATAVAVALIGGLGRGLSTHPEADPDPLATGETRTVVEGRVTAKFPASWSIHRVTSGPGSRRLQADSPVDPGFAVHLTQSYAPESTISQAAASLGAVIATQPAGVFADFDAEARVGERPALTYREIRPGREIEWTVVVVGSTRIGVGCQSPPGRMAEVRPVCLSTLASAQDQGTEPRP